jgi:hypothetical protein
VTRTTIGGISVLRLVVTLVDPELSAPTAVLSTRHTESIDAGNGKGMP